MTLLWRRLPGILFVCFLSGSLTLASQARTQSVTDGVYSSEQATRGQALYATQCSKCHGGTLGGQVGPPLAGNDFNAKWSSQTLLDLANKIRRTMPSDQPDRPTDPQTADLVAYILQSGKFPSGRSALLMEDAALKQVTFPATAVAQTQSPAGPSSLLPATGNLAQVMRGILFPSSNIIFTVQSVDPGVKKKPSNTGAEVGFDWLVWGGDVYKGWEVVDYAAVAIGESAQLMLTPGRTCENGKPVPINDPDWIKFTKELADAGKAAYKASQTRNQEITSDSTNQLNDSCSHCHGVFRGRTHCVKR
jgi:mono/diheme cytochrome c family protein